MLDMTSRGPSVTEELHLALEIHRTEGISMTQAFKLAAEEIRDVLSYAADWDAHVEAARPAAVGAA